jgi:hypothetical protein
MAKFVTCKCGHRHEVQLSDQVPAQIRKLHEQRLKKALCRECDPDRSSINFSERN